MPPRQVLKNFNCFIDGVGYAGKMESYSPPALTLKTEEWRGAGMDAPETIDMGMEKLEASFVLVEYDARVLGLFGSVPGGEIRVMARGALQGPEGIVIPVVHTLRGKIVSSDPGEWKAGEKPSLEVMMDLHFYSLVHGGVPVHTIDVRNFIRMINGVDQLLAMRTAIGV